MTVRPDTVEFLKKVPLFSDLSEDDLKHLSEDAQEVHLPAGEQLFEEGSPGNRAYVIRDGLIEVVKKSAGREILLALQEPPAVVGEMALIENKPRNASVRARTDSVLVAITQEQLEHLLETSASAARAMFYTVIARWRDTEGLLRQTEKMAQLGTLSAGVAHELNNPAAAVKRAVSQLQSTLQQYEEASLHIADLSDVEQQSLKDVTIQIEGKKQDAERLDALARSDLEQELIEALDDLGIEDGWDLASPLVSMGFDRPELEALIENLDRAHLQGILTWLTVRHTVYDLLNEMGQGATRISDIVRALKSYSYLDQAPVQSVDVHEGLDNTLLILRHKLKSAITVSRDYASDLPKIEAFGSELNQVWTNIIDNAADALGEEGGHISIRTRRDDEGIIVEIEDNGPGIPEEIGNRVFDSFFTTKPPGKGTGLGLNISYNIIVDKHRGELTFDSSPGKTTFRIWLPLTTPAS
jgi:signal transduction histidine kinase